MDELFLLAGELIENEGYKKDEYEGLPDGEYNVLFDGVTLKKSEEKGTEWFSLRLKVIDGDYANRVEYANLFLTEKTVKRTLSIIMKLIDALGYEVSIESFEDKNTILDVLKTMIGESTVYHKSTSSGGFVNHSFKKGE